MNKLKLSGVAIAMAAWMQTAPATDLDDLEVTIEAVDASMIGSSNFINTLSLPEGIDVEDDDSHDDSSDDDSSHDDDSHDDDLHDDDLHDDDSHDGMAEEANEVEDDLHEDANEVEDELDDTSDDDSMSDDSPVV